jgi:anti-sigma regulatory factor (Ser/Thr protein kinase)
MARLGPAFSAGLLVARLNPATGALTWSSAGLPAPVLGLPRGLVGPRLGAVPATHVQNEESVPPGAHLVLSTADLAVLTVRRRPVPVEAAVADLPDIAATWVYPLVPTAAGTLRRDLRAALSGGRFDPDLLDDLLLAATEAVNNAVEHAQQPRRPEVEVRLRVARGVVRIVVQDFGGWRQRPPARDRGRGALLMNAYGDVRVSATPTGTRVSIERRWVAPPARSAGPGR